MMRLLQRIVVVSLFIVSSTQLGFAMDRFSVCVSIVPQKYFVQQIGKERVDVRVMVPPGANPATYEPKPRQMAALLKTRIYFAVGVPFENVWLKKIAAANPKMKMIHTDSGIKKIPMATHHHDKARSHYNNSEHRDETYEHHEKGEDYHERGVLDPHIWLSPPLVKKQTLTILKALQEIDPFHRSIYEVNYNQFISKIDELDVQLKISFADTHGLQFMVLHPSWGYFAQAYGLEQVPIEIEGKNPKPAQLKRLIEYAREKGIKMIFVQPQFSTKSAELVAKEIGGQVAHANPLAEDWMANLIEVAYKFKAAMK